MGARGWCPRCQDEVGVLRPWPGFRAMWWAWCGVVGALAVLLPLYFVDVCVMVPSAMLVALAGGPLRRLATERPVCLVCSFEIDRARPDGSGVRPRAFSRSVRGRSDGNKDADRDIRHTA